MAVTASLVLLTALTLTPGADAPGSPRANASGPPVPEEVARAVRQLGDNDYHVREAAARRLWSIGAAAEPALRQGLRSADAEVVARCRDLLDKIPYGITPDMPRRLVELIATARSGGPGAAARVVPELLDLGPQGLDVARKLTDRLGADHPGVREEMRQAIDREGWRLAPALIAEGQDDRAEELLERSAVAADARDPSAVRHYATFLKLRGRADAQLGRWRALAEKGLGRAGGPDNRLPDGSPDGRVSALVLVHLARLQGDLTQARWAADKLGRPELREAVLFDQGAWAELAALDPPGQPNAVAALGLRAMYHQLAGQDDPARAARAEVKKLGDVQAYDAAWLAFRALMFAGHPDDALAVLAKNKSPYGLLPQFEILCQQYRYDEALPRLERPVGEHTPSRWQWDAAKLRVYHQRGERDRYRQTLDRLTVYDRLVPTEQDAAQDLVERLVALGRAEDALPVAAALLNSGAAPAAVFGKLFPKAPLAAETWWRYLRLQQPAAPMRETVARLPALLDKRLAGAEGQALLQAAAPVARAQPAAEAERWLLGLGEACQAAGLADEARRLYEEAVGKADGAAAGLKLGDLHAEAGRWADAAAAYERTWRRDIKQPLPLWLAGWAKARAGQADGRTLMERAHALLLGHEDQRTPFAEELMKRSALGPGPAEAARQERRLLLRLGGPGSHAARSAEGVLSGDPLAYPDRLAAADASQRFLLRMLRTNAYFRRNEGYLVVLYRLHDNRARGLLARGDVEGALHAAETAQAVLPGSVGLAAHLVPELVKRSRTAEADRIYAAAAEAQDKLCRDYPDGPLFHNERAWLAARGRRDLDAALGHARKAAELAPRQGGYHDTLAEVYFQRGETRRALEEIGRALELEPKNTYFAQQKRRLEAGDRDAPLPEGR